MLPPLSKERSLSLLEEDPENPEELASTSLGPLPDPPPPPRSFPPFLGLAVWAGSSLDGADVFWETEEASGFMEVGWPPSCSLSFPKPTLVFSPSTSPPSFFISFSTGFLMGPALLLPPIWLEGLWSDGVLEESSPPRELFPPPALLALLP